MANQSMSIPNGLPTTTTTMSVGNTLTLTVAGACNWCYADPTGVFTDWPPAGSYALKSPPEVFSPKAAKTGEVTINATLPGITCTTAAMPHRIIVT